ncbi:MAG: ORF6N domain-containing protein [Candidatus Margulisiibacteriota bacterium]
MMLLKIVDRNIYQIRGLKVMLDRDLAELYGVKPIRLREQVKRNPGRFPADFMFRLNETETRWLVSQNAIPTTKSLGGSLPLVFTEHGALMLSSVLNTERAIKMGIFIVRAFVKMREMAGSYKALAVQIREMERTYDKRFRIVFSALRKIIDPPIGPKKRIGFLRGGEA